MQPPKNISRRLRALSRTVYKKKPLRVVPPIDGKRFLFLGGLHRSGTSILHRLLREHNDASGFANTFAPQDEGQHLQTVFPPATQYGGPGRFAFHPASYINESSDLVSTESRDRLLREWCPYYDLSKNVLLEKSPPNLVRSRFFQAIFPTASFVFIMRHPAAVTLATQRMARTGKASVLEMMLHWYAAHKVLFNDVKRLRNSVIFRYEDFVVSPQFYVDRICELAGLSSFSPQESVVDHNPKYLARWMSDYVSERQLLETVFPNIVQFYGRLGYSLAEPFTNDLDSGPFISGTAGDR